MMRIFILMIGKNERGFIADGCESYRKRIARYFPLEMITLAPKGKSGTIEQQKTREGELLLNKIPDKCFVVLLDESGRDLTSVRFAELITSRGMEAGMNLCFLIGGPYGVPEQVKQRSDIMIKLSSMTFSHQLVRILFMEQLYRALTIIHREPYHHA